MLKDELEKIVEKCARNYYVPLYPDNKAIEEMTQYEQGLIKHFRAISGVIAQATATWIESKLPKERIGAIKGGGKITATVEALEALGALDKLTQMAAYNQAIQDVRKGLGL